MLPSPDGAARSRGKSGGGGMCDDFPLAYAYAGARTLRFADGPDEVHRNAIAKWELGKYGTYGRDAGVPITRGA